MSRNQEIKFAKWWEENILDEYRNEKHNYFLDDDWFNSLPKELKELIIKIDDSSWNDDDYEYYLEELEYEIKSYLRKYKHWNYNDEEIQYLFDFSDFCQAEEDNKIEMQFNPLYINKNNIDIQGIISVLKTN